MGNKALTIQLKEHYIAESGAVSIGVRLTTKDSFSGYLKVVSSIPSTGSVTLGYVCW